MKKDQKKKQIKYPGVVLMEWCREYSKKQIEQLKMEREK